MKYSIIFSLLGLVFFSSSALARSWECNVDVHLLNSSASYATSWGMKTGDQHAVWGDREKSCRRYIEAKILDGSIWSKLSLSSSEENAVCKSGSGVFKANYGFDSRPKSWNLNKAVSSPSCGCETICPDGWWVDGSGSRCATGVCGAPGLENKEFLDDDNGLYIWNGSIYQAQKSQVGNCSFN